MIQIFFLVKIKYFILNFFFLLPLSLSGTVIDDPDKKILTFVYNFAGKTMMIQT